MGAEFLGTICPWGLNWLGTVCPEGTINWGSIVGEPNVREPYGFETKCVTAFCIPNMETREVICHKVEQSGVPSNVPNAHT